MSKVEEKYHRAAQSSHLELKRTDESPGDVDTIIAAGLAETMGILLTRLRGEWDSKRGDMAIYKKRANELAAQAKVGAANAITLRKKASEPTKSYEEYLTRQLAAGYAERDIAFLQDEIVRELSTAHALMFMGLRSLEPAKQLLFLFAHRQAPHKACNSDEKALAALVGRVLDVWLDRTCHECQGRGFSGGYGSARIMCRSAKLGGCGGSGSRTQGKLSGDPAEQAFGLWLINVLDSRTTVSMQQVQRKTRQGDTPAAAAHESDAEALRRRITDLKSPAAEAD